MGICGSKDSDASTSKSGSEPSKTALASETKLDSEASTAKPTAKAAGTAAAPEKKLDPKDFMLQKLEGKTIVKEPG